MGLLSFLSPSSTPTTTSPPPPPGTAPNRTQRARCWDARDTFFRCLDAHDILDATKLSQSPAAAKECKALREGFERECVGSWVEYFNKRRVMEANRESMLKKLEAEGAKPMAAPLPTPVGQAQRG